MFGSQVLCHLRNRPGFLAIVGVKISGAMRPHSFRWSWSIDGSCVFEDASDEARFVLALLFDFAVLLAALSFFCEIPS